MHTDVERAMIPRLAHRGGVPDERGAVLAIVTLFTMIVLIGVAALVIDLGNGRQSRLQAQSAADAAALAGATQFLPALITTGGMTSANWTATVTEVQSFMQTNYGVPAASWSGCSDSAQLAYAPDSGNQDTCISSDSQSAPTLLRVVVPPKALEAYFGGMTGTKQLNISAAAVAKVPTTSPCAVCALSSTGNSDLGNGGISVSGSGNSDVWINSSLTCGGANGGIMAPGGVDVNGGVGKDCSPAMSGAGTIQDPLGGLPAAPIMTGLTSQPDCTAGNAKPGLYNNIGGCVLSPGLYVVIGTMGGNVSISGSGVTLFFTCGSYDKKSGTVTVAACSPGASGGQLDVSGSKGSLTITACDVGSCGSDAVSGLAVWYDRNNMSPITLDGNGGLGISGTIYAPSSTLYLNGSPSTLSGTCAGVNLCSTVVVGQFNFNGHGTITVDSGASGSLALGQPVLYR